MKIRPLKIGDLSIDFPVMLAPMAGYTDLVMRGLSKRYGCGLAFTEVTNAEGIVRRQPITMQLLDTADDEQPVAAHIYGSNPEVMARAAAIIEELGRFQLIDINCGCPVRKVVAKGAGVALMRDPDKINTILKAVKSAVKLPVTVKTRLGTTPRTMNISEFAHAVEDGGGDAIFLHCRFASERHYGQFDWAALARIKYERSIPVIGNGGVNVPEDVPRMIAETNVDGVMIGRAAIGNPWIFAQIRRLLEGEKPVPHPMSEHRAVIEEHLRGLTELKIQERARRGKKSKITAEHSAVLHFRAHLIGYLRGFPGLGALRRNLQELHSIDDVMEAVDRVISEPH